MVEVEDNLVAVLVEAAAEVDNWCNNSTLDEDSWDSAAQDLDCMDKCN